MSQYFVIHPQDPQPRLIHQAVAILNNGGVIAYPTDSTYALGCVLGDTDAQKRIRDIAASMTGTISRWFAAT